MFWDAQDQSHARIVRLRATHLEGRRGRRARAQLEAMTTDASVVVVDLGPLVHADSSLWIGIVHAAQDLRQRGGDLRVCGGTAEARALFLHLALHRTVDLDDDVRQSLRALDPSKTVRDRSPLRLRVIA